MKSIQARTCVLVTRTDFLRIMDALEILWEYRPAFARGLSVTLELWFSAAFFGTLLGVLLEFLTGGLGKGVRKIIDLLAFCFAAIPGLVLLFWIYYPGQALIGRSISPFWTAVFALSLINTFAIYRIMADAFRDFPSQYVATGLVCGLTRSQIFFVVKIPLLMRNILPRWIDQQVVIIQTSVFASLISVEETFRVAQRINSEVYEPVVIYSAMALIFLVIIGMTMFVSKHVRQRFHRDLSER